MLFEVSGLLFFNFLLCVLVWDKLPTHTHMAPHHTMCPTGTSLPPQNLGIDPNLYENRILIQPDLCNFGGLGDVGCSSAGCYSWIIGSYVKTMPMSMVHELGHNMGLQHASTPTLNYGDSSSPMGLGLQSQRYVRCGYCFVAQLPVGHVQTEVPTVPCCHQ